MQKLKDLLEKLKIALNTAKQKIPFLKKKADAATANTNAIKPQKKDGTLAKIYRSGNYKMRVGVILVIIFGIVFLISSTHLGIQIFQRIKKTAGKTDLQKDYANQFEGLAVKAAESASIIGLGKVIGESYRLGANKGYVSLEVWVKCDSPKTATYADSIEARLHDKMVDILKTLAQEEVNLLTDEGKSIAKQNFLKALNHELEIGKILEIYFHNMIMQ